MHKTDEANLQFDFVHSEVGATPISEWTKSRLTVNRAANDLSASCSSFKSPVK